MPDDDERAHMDGHDLELVHVLVMFRHGDRSPITRRVGERIGMSDEELQFWVSRLAGFELLQELGNATRVVLAKPAHRSDPTDLEAPPSPRHGGQWPCGQLTAKGAEEMKHKGRHLRARYPLLLRQLDPTADVYVHSTNIRRTIRSAQCLLAGLFPAHFEHSNAVSCGLGRPQEIPIHVDSHNSLGPSHPWELFRDLDRLLGDDLRQRAPPGLRETSQQIREVTGLDHKRLIPWSSLREILVCRHEHGLPFPEGFDSELFQRIYELDAWLWHTLYGKRDFCVGSFRRGVERFLERVEAIAKNSTQHKLTLFSAHDNSLVALMRALQLQVDQRLLPAYGAMLAFEFHRHPVSRALYVRARFEGQEIAFAGHEHAALCPIDHVRWLAQDFLAHRVLP